HRDIKPSNILFDDDGYAYLADFGIVRLAEMTRTVTLIGTPEYMTPEQIRGEAIDGRSDIYQMGVVVFEMLTGRQPFTGESTAALLYKHAHEPAPPLRDLNAALPSACDEVIQRALAKQPDARYAHAGDLAAALAAALQKPETVTRTAVPSVLVEQSRARQEPAPPEQAAPEPVTRQAAPAKPQREPAAAPQPIPAAPQETAAAGPDTAVSLPFLSQEDWRGFGWWVAGSTLGWLLALFLARPVSTAADAYSYGYFWPPALILAMIGLVWGAGQWLALRAYHPVGARWIGATAVGFWLPGMFFILIGGAGLGISGGILLDLATGLWVGGAQWLLLRRRMANAWVWIPAVTVGLLLNRWLSLYFYNHYNYYFDSYGLPAGSLWIFVSLLNGALWGVITGAALVWLVGRARTDAPATS
ncbi:MAG: protein kinase, partial [Anaerolineales bacterium]|nr:protein kinase [Anaerolineales bacterium]